LCTSRGDWLVLAGYDAENLRRGRVLQVRRMYWSKDDWPVAGEALSATQKFDARKDTPPSAAGTWKLWVDFVPQQPLTLGTDGKTTAGREGAWRQVGRTLIFDWKAQDAEDLVLEADGRCFVGRNARGQVIFGQRTGP
jgi:hypothetical protein